LQSSTARLAAQNGCRILSAPLHPIPRLLVLGGGLDAIPLVGMAVELGWFVTVADHRPAYLARGGFQRADRAVLVEPGKLAASLALNDFDAIVAMSHHLATDRKYLAELAPIDVRYLGVLGPRARRDRLLADLADTAPQLKQRLKGPVGLDIGADSPESIALSILAELQSTLSTR
jgi:xanthine/CO dehydrogenase XdhC/CoxF family maturation factor